jgi:hypothetical protein
MGQAPDSLRDPSNASNAPRLIDRFRAAIRSRHYGRRTEKTYWFWIRYIIFHNNKRHPVQDNPRDGVRARGREMEQEAVRAGNRESGSWKKERLLISTSRSPDLTISRYKRG